MSQQYEYAVMDSEGQQVGFPARTFTSREAADNVVATLKERIEAMGRAAEKAQQALDTDAPAIGVGPLSAADKATCREMIETYEQNKDAQFRVMRRLVGAWEAVT